ncbi:hypothetical protein ACFYPB_40590 [Streptomyces olivaceoviridis]|uniref:hypothetical protein n=1 Tax=Streptomyces olivaceoviridis TaxID=1921 RepID=UPI003678FAD1
MIELVLLIAIAYAGARGVESIAATSDRRHDTPTARKTVEKVAASGPKGSGEKKPPGPTEPGGTFSAAAPRAAKVGGKAAVPLAVLTETGSTMWKAVLEGYRDQWPQIRAEHRQKMADKAARKKEERAAAEAKKKADEALAKAGPPPAHPPMPAEPPQAPDGIPEAADAPDADVTTPDTPGESTDPAASIPGPRSAGTAEERADAREATAPPASRPQEVTSWPGDGSARLERHPEPADDSPADDSPAGRRHLSVVPDPAQNGDPMSSPSMVIPEIRTLDGLMNALTLTKAMCEMRAEEALAIASDDQQLSNRLDQLEAELAELEVDAKTRGEITELRESIQAQSQAAAQYGAAAKDAGDFAVAAAAAAYKSHGGIAEAVQSSPIEKAAQAGYYER